MQIPSTLCEMLAGNRNADREVIYLEGEHHERRVRFSELHERALGILHHLQALGAKAGDRIILYLNDNEQFVDAFFAAVLGGIVPVPVAVGISDEHRHKLMRIAALLREPFIYTDRKTLQRIGKYAEQHGQSAILAALQDKAFYTDDLTDIGRSGRPFAARPEDTAFVQFSSGSTSDPKGVVLTHGNIMANARGAGIAAGFSDADQTLSWMPLTHDMGLIGMTIFMMSHRMNVGLMSTELFIRRPLLWLQFASRLGSTILASPNFGYRHYLKVLGERSYESLDLSRVRILFNGAEPISVDLCEEFLARMAAAGLARRAMFPVYGLAEASLAVSFPKLGQMLHSICVDRHQLAVGDRPAMLATTARDATQLMSVGRAIPHCELRICDDSDQALAAGLVGHIQIRGENVTHGYLDNPQANSAAFAADGWLRTGDLGLIHDGDLYIAGRDKEIIFVNGQNYYPHDLEDIAVKEAGLELGKVVAIGARPRGAQADQVVVFVLHRQELTDFLPVANAVARALNEHTGIEIAEVVPVKRIPKTTSGKIQRVQLETAYVDGEFDTELGQLAALRAAQQRPGAAAASDIEARLLGICEQALQGQALGLDDNLFEIGASSLKLIEIHEQIDQTYPGSVDLTELFDYPTIRELAAFLEQKLAAA
ncbi:MAG: non-ribosomal peptide synthetase [Steroidobacteraceae bacterium]